MGIGSRLVSGYFVLGLGSADDSLQLCDGQWPALQRDNLIWGQQQPSWISSLDSARQYQEVVDWIRLYAEHCPDARPALQWLVNYVSQNPTGVKSISGMPPSNYILAQNYPNPFNPSRVITCDLPSNSHVTLQVYDMLGRLVKTLVDRVQSAGEHSATFQSSGLASGMYFYRLQVGDRSLQKKMMLIK